MDLRHQLYAYITSGFGHINFQALFFVFTVYMRYSALPRLRSLFQTQ